MQTLRANLCNVNVSVSGTVTKEYPNVNLVCVLALILFHWIIFFFVIICALFECTYS